MNNTDITKLPFPQRIKAESNGYGILSKEFVARNKAKENGYYVQLAKKLGRAITDNELRSMNI
jgi:hypothetical protein